MAAVADMRLDVDVPALRAQEGEIADGGFGAWQDDDVRVRGDGLARPHEYQLHTRLHAKRIEVVEIGDAREHWHGDEAH